MRLSPALTGVDAPALKPLYPKWWGEAPVKLGGFRCPNAGSCIKCHEKNQEMDQQHAFSCVTCHKGNAECSAKDCAHEGLIADPGDLDFVDQTCGKCHPKHAQNVKSSPMALAPKLINHTRYAFGAQETSSPMYGVRCLAGLKQIPIPEQELSAPAAFSGENLQHSDLPKNIKPILRSLGDDLLRRSCLRCHLYTKGSSRAGEQRGKGCSACHTPYSNSDSNKPYAHTIVKSLGITPCLKCHNANHTGCDYVGLFEKDFNRGFRSPIVDGAQPPTIYGSEQHFLQSDIHYKAGMICSDCHTSDEIHGSGKQINSDLPQSLSCESCHVNFNHPLIMKTTQGELVLKHRPDKKIPRQRLDIIPHRVAEHRKTLSCAACHAGWSFQDYGSHLMLDERAEYWMWSINSAYNDPQTQELLRKFVGDYAELVPRTDGIKPALAEKDWALPQTKDWLNGQIRPGAWFGGFTIRRWSGPPLGLDSRGKVTIMRPMRQYEISWVKADGTVVLDSVIPTTGAGKPALMMEPYSPHTIQKRGRQCHNCHGDPKAVGLGYATLGNKTFTVQPILSPERKKSGVSFRWDALLNEDGTPLQSSSYPGAGPLDPELFKKLLFPGFRFRSIWSQYLSGSQ
ncbi:MAG: hypothetical protein ACP5VS_07130 [Desulfomonilaceae bacterium]